MDTVGKNEKMIADYIKNQLEEDFAKDRISLKEFADTFTGERNTLGKKQTATFRSLTVIVMR